MAIKATNKRPKSNKATGRNYTYDKQYQKSKKQVDNRVARNKARREATRKLGKSAVKGKDVGHNSMLRNAKDPDKVKTKLESRKQNRGKDNKKVANANKKRKK